MYSVVLAAMLSAGGQTTGHWWHGCHGCYGGYSCYGCYGCRGAWVYSYSCHGCFGCSGCWGCHGCHGVVVSPVVVYGYSCSGCYGGCSGCYGGWIVSGCHGCSGGAAVHHRPGPGGGGGGPPPDLAPRNEAERDAVRRLLKALRDEKKGGKGDEKKGGKDKDRDREEYEESSIPDNAARVTVRLPNTARLWVDGVYCPLTSEVRSFNTPALQPGQNYVYTLRVQYEQEGQAREESRRVQVAAGREVNVDFNNVVSTVRR